MGKEEIYNKPTTTTTAAAAAAAATNNNNNNNNNNKQPEHQRDGETSTGQINKQEMARKRNPNAKEQS